MAKYNVLQYQKLVQCEEQEFDTDQNEESLKINSETEIGDYCQSELICGTSDSSLNIGERADDSVSAFTINEALVFNISDASCKLDSCEVVSVESKLCEKTDDSTSVFVVSDVSTKLDSVEGSTEPQTSQECLRHLNSENSSSSENCSSNSLNANICSSDEKSDCLSHTLLSQRLEHAKGSDVCTNELCASSKTSTENEYSNNEICPSFGNRVSGDADCSSSSGILSTFSINASSLENNVNVEKIECISIDVVANDILQTHNTPPNSNEQLNHSYPQAKKAECSKRNPAISTLRNRSANIKIIPKYLDQNADRSKRKRRNAKGRRISAKMKMLLMKQLETNGYLVCPMEGCFQKYVTVANFQTHYKYCTGKQNLEHCPYCDSLIFSGREAVLQHMQVEHPENVYKYKDTISDATDICSLDHLSPKKAVRNSFSSKTSIPDIKSIERTMIDNYKEFKQCVRFNDIVQKINSVRVGGEPIFSDKERLKKTASTKLFVFDGETKKGDMGVFEEKKSLDNEREIERECVSDGSDSIDCPSCETEKRVFPKRISTKSRIVLNTQGYERFNQYLKVTRDWASERKTYSRNKSADNSLNMSQNEASLSYELQDTYQLNESLEHTGMLLSVTHTEPEISLVTNEKMSVKSSMKKNKLNCIKDSNSFILTLKDTSSKNKTPGFNKADVSSDLACTDICVTKNNKYPGIEKNCPDSVFNYGHLLFSKPNKVANRERATCYDNAGNFNPDPTKVLSVHESNCRKSNTSCHKISTFTNGENHKQNIDLFESMKAKEHLYENTPGREKVKENACNKRDVCVKFLAHSLNRENINHCKVIFSAEKVRTRVLSLFSSRNVMREKGDLSLKQLALKVWLDVTTKIFDFQMEKSFFACEKNFFYCKTKDMVYEGEPPSLKQSHFLKCYFDYATFRNEKETGSPFQKCISDFIFETENFCCLPLFAVEKLIILFMPFYSYGFWHQLDYLQLIKEYIFSYAKPMENILSKALSTIDERASYNIREFEKSLFPYRTQCNSHIKPCMEHSTEMEKKGDCVDGISSMWEKELAHNSSVSSGSVPVKKKKRGRPPKKVNLSLSNENDADDIRGKESTCAKFCKDSNVTSVTAKKRRGRPPKKKIELVGPSKNALTLISQNLPSESSSLHLPPEENSDLCLKNAHIEIKKKSVKKRRGRPPNKYKTAAHSKLALSKSVKEANGNALCDERGHYLPVATAVASHGISDDIERSLDLSNYKLEDSASEKDKSCLGDGSFDTSLSTAVPFSHTTLKKKRGRPPLSKKKSSQSEHIHLNDEENILGESHKQIVQTTENAGLSDLSVCPQNLESVGSTSKVDEIPSKVVTIRKSTRLKKKKEDPDTIFIPHKRRSRTSTNITKASTSHDQIRNDSKEIRRRGRPRKNEKKHTETLIDTSTNGSNDILSNNVVAETSTDCLSEDISMLSNKKCVENKQLSDDKKNMHTEEKRSSSREYRKCSRKGRPRRCVRYAEGDIYINSGIESLDSAQRESSVCLSENLTKDPENQKCENDGTLNVAAPASNSSTSCERVSLCESTTDSKGIQEEAGTLSEKIKVYKRNKLFTYKSYGQKTSSIYTAKNFHRLNRIKQLKYNQFCVKTLRTQVHKSVKTKLGKQKKAYQPHHTHSLNASLDRRNMPRVRKAALKARKLFSILNEREDRNCFSSKYLLQSKQIEKDAVDASFELEMYKEFFTASSIAESRVVSRDQICQWINKLETDGKLTCEREECKKVLGTKAGMIYHYEHACLRASQRWLCNLCQIHIKPSSEAMLKHLKKKHQKILKNKERQHALTQKSKRFLLPVCGYAGIHFKDPPMENDFNDALIFSELKTRRSYYEPMESSLFMKEYVPLHKSKVKVRVCDCRKKTSKELQYISLAPFETYPNSVGTSQATFFTGGGPVWSGSWIPVAKEHTKQYLVIATGSELGKYYHALSTDKERGILEVYDCGNLGGNTFVAMPPALKLAIPLNYGKIYHISCCPASYEDPSVATEKENDQLLPRLGLIALACGDGFVRIISLPHPDFLLKECNQLAICNAKPVALLKSAQKMNSSCTSLSWQKTKECHLIACGYSTGIVSVWKIGTRNTRGSLLQEKIPSDQMNIMPFITFQPHSTAVTGVEFVSLGNGRYLATCSTDKTTKLFDLLEPHVPIMQSTKGWCEALGMPIVGTGVFVCFNDRLNTKSAIAYHDFGIPGKKIHVADHNLYSQAFSISENTNVVALGDLAGEVTASMLTCANKEQCKLARKQYPVFRTELMPLKNDDNPDGVCEQNCGLTFIDSSLDTINVPEEEREDTETYTSVENNINAIFANDCYPSSITSMAFNPNVGCHHWLFTANKAGIGRIVSIPSLKSA